MTIRIYYCDLRNHSSQCIRAVVLWKSEITAKQAVSQALGVAYASSIENDLIHDNKHLIVAWNDMTKGEISEVGGVGTLESS